MRALVLVLLFASGTVAAERGPAFSASTARLQTSEGFLDVHRDMKYRFAGLAAYEKGELDVAMTEFKRAARFADKVSQGMVAEMLWNGQGHAQDRAAAYAWMDLAAERGYRVMLLKREHYWAALNADERERALALGQGIYAEYGDAVAKGRLEDRLHRAKTKVTGSRTGFVGPMQVSVNTPNGILNLDGNSYYRPEYWRADRYWNWQDSIWKDPPVGTVDIGPLEPTPGPDTE